METILQAGPRCQAKTGEVLRNLQTKVDLWEQQKVIGICFLGPRPILPAAGHARAMVSKALHALADSAVLEYFRKIKAPGKMGHS